MLTQVHNLEILVVSFGTDFAIADQSELNQYIIRVVKLSKTTDLGRC